MTAEKRTEHKKEYRHIWVESMEYPSDYLDRVVKIDVYQPKYLFSSRELSILFVNDGQDLPKMPFTEILDKLYHQNAISPIMVVGIHCSADRKLEYGTADILDFLNRGSRAKFHRKFLMKELIPAIMGKYNLSGVKEMAYAGFSLGGLSAIDVAWKYPKIFSKVGVFSGSFWWRLRDLDDDYNEDTDRIIHKIIREGQYHEGMKFFFQTGTLDETMDRNNNGIIDSIDDTLGLIEELEAKGYDRETDIRYLELSDGRHDVPTWGRAFPVFLKWGWGK
ncbi:MAG: esterase family protein [Chitinophagaceae bacterium]|jgi:enterochelin esterase-like enzyme|nr:esterase family protein [Chitinophagaceae bacterium]